MEKVREIIKIAQEPVSLETPIGEEEDSPSRRLYPRRRRARARARPPRFTLLKEQLDERARHAHPAREEGACACASAWRTAAPARWRRSAQEFNVTRERIRQIEAKALRKLRHPSRSKKLKDYLE